MKPGLVALLVVTACGGSTSTPQPADKPAIDAPAACSGGDMAACVEVARAACTGDAWQVDFDRPPALYVAPSGLARLDRLNMVLLSTNSAEWLACIEECPGTGTRNVCIPFVLDMRVELAPRKGCTESEREVLEWNGRPARTKLRDCPDELAEITYVPGLAGVQKSLVASKTIEAGGPLDIGGLVVKLTVAGTPVMTVSKVGEADCSVFDVPANYQLVRGAAPFEKARAMQPQLQREFDEAQAALRRELEAAISAARARVEPEVRDLCKSKGFNPDDGEALAQCTVENEEVRAIITKAVSEEMERARIEAEPKVDDALRKHVIEPLCREFAPAVATGS